MGIITDILPGAYLRIYGKPAFTAIYTMRRVNLVIYAIIDICSNVFNKSEASRN